MLSISFEGDVSTGNVGGSLLFKHQRQEVPRGSGGMPPRKFWNLDTLKCYFHRFPDSIWATTKIKYVYFNGSFPQNLNHWLLEKSELIIKSSNADSKKIHSMFCPLEKTCSAMSGSFFGGDAILAHANAWDLVLWRCPRHSMTLRSASTNTSTERLTLLKLLKCTFT